MINETVEQQKGLPLETEYFINDKKKPYNR